MTRKQNRKTKHYSLPKLLKSVRQGNLHAEFGFKTSILNVRLDAAQVAELKELAKEHGTTLAQELDNAIDAYVLGMSQGELRLFKALVDRLIEATANANKALDAALRKTKKTRTHSTRKQRSGQR
ncbi:MAG: hypothetical protein ACYC9L_03645 [Sulfuricaulis sp.]